MEGLDFRMALYAVAALFMGGATLGGLAIGVRESAMTLRRNARLRGEQTAEAKPIDLVAQAASQVVQGAGRIGNHMATRDPAQITVLRLQMIQAGFGSREAVPIYLGIRVTCLAVATLGAILTLPWLITTGGKLGAVIGVGVGALVAILAPAQFVGMRRRKMEIEYREGFPDVLDLLVASVEAGLSLDAAVSRVAEELGRRHPRLSEHLKFLTLELRAGKPRKDAWTNLADRLGIDEARSFATMLRQAETMGSSLGETLAVFAQDMRIKRMLRAEEKAMALSAKLTVPLILFIFPALLAVLMLPSIFRVSQSFAGQG